MKSSLLSICLIWLFSVNTFSQTFTVSPNRFLTKERVVTRIKGQGLSFSTTEATECPSKLNVTASDVTLTQASPVVEISAKSVTVIGSDSLLVDFGYVNLNNASASSITLGKNSGCPVKLENAVQIERPVYTFTNGSYYPGQEVAITFNSADASFANTGSCPTLALSNTSITFIAPTGEKFNSKSVVVNNTHSFTTTVRIPEAAPVLSNYNVVIGEGLSCADTCFSCFAVSAPAVSFSPNSGGKNVILSIKGKGVHFNNTGTVCPAKLQVSASDVVLQQASPTMDIPATSLVIVNDSTLSASFSIPNPIQGMRYGVLIGKSSNCTVQSVDHYYVAPINISVENVNTFNTGSTSDIFVRANSDVFSNTRETICWDTYPITNETIILRRGSTIIKPLSNVLSSANSFNAKFTFDGPEGNYDVVVGNGSTCEVVCTGCVTLQSFNPILSVIAPNQFEARSLGSVSLRSSNFEFSYTDSTACPFKINIKKENIALKRNNIFYYPSTVSGIYSGGANANFYFPDTVGTYDVVVGKGTDCEQVCIGCISIVPPQPRINVSGEPFNAGEQSQVVIVGTNVSFQSSGTSNCPYAVTANVNNIQFVSANPVDGKYPTFFPSAVSVSGNKIVATITPNDTLPGGCYKLKVGDDCPIYYDCFSLQGKIKDFYVNKSIISRNQASTISVFSNWFTFSTNSSCPNINITTENVQLRQGSFVIKPSRVYDIKTNSFRMDITPPSNAPSGSYHVIIGANTACAFEGRYKVDINSPYFTVSTSNSFPGRTAEITLSSVGATFTLTDSSVCPARIKVRLEDLTVSAGIKKLIPKNLVATTNNNITFEVDIPDNDYATYYSIGIKECGLPYNTFQVKTVPTPSIKNVFVERGDRLDITVSGVDEVFYQGSSTVNYNIPAYNKDNVVLKRGSSIIKPTSFPLGHRMYYGSFDIPKDAEVGKYELVFDYESSPKIVSKGEVILYDYFSTNTHPGKRSMVRLKGIGDTLMVDTSFRCLGISKIQKENFFIDTSPPIYADSISSNANEITAFFKLDDTLSTRPYDLVMKGEGSCTEVLRNKFRVTSLNPTFTVSASNAVGHIGANFETMLTGKGIDFNNRPSVCPSSISVENSTIYLRKDSIIIKASTINSASLPNQYPTINIGLNIPLGVPQGKYDVVIEPETGCPIICKECVTIQGWIEVVSKPLLYSNQVNRITLKGRGVDFSSERNNCPKLIKVDTSNIVITGLDSLPKSYKILSVSIDSVDQISVHVKAPASLPNNGEYLIFSVSNGDGCTYSSPSAYYYLKCDSFDINSVNIAGEANPCPNIPYKYYLTGVHGNNYSWQTSEGQILTQTSDTAMISWEPGDRYASMSVSNSCGEKNYASVYISDHQSAFDIWGDERVCKGSVKNYVVRANGFGSYYNLFSTSQRFKWLLEDGVILSDSGGFAQIHWNKDGAFKLLAVIDNCTSTDTLVKVVEAGNFSDKPKIFEIDPTRFLSSSSVGNQWYYEGVQIEGATSSFITSGYEPGYYAVEVEDGCGTTISDYKFSQSTLVNTISKKPKDYLKISPNPASKNIAITVPSFLVNDNSKTEIFDSMGKLVKASSMTSKETTIDIDDLENGLYFIQVTYGTELTSEKLVIQK